MRVFMQNQILEVLIQSIKQHSILWSWITIPSIISGWCYKYPKYKHARYLIRIIPLTIISCIIITLFQLDVITLHAVGIISLPYLLMIYIAYRTINNLIYPITLKLGKCENLLQEGDFSKLDEMLEDMSWYIFYTYAKLRWGELKCYKLSQQGKYKESYPICTNLLSLDLFQDEKDEIILIQVRCLLELGDTLRARSLFEQIPYSDMPKNRSKILSLQSSFDEITGKFKEALQNLLGSLSELDKNDGVETDMLGLATIYNNIARMETMLSNRTDTIHYYKKSARLAKDLKQNHLIHTAYQNLIDTLLLDDNQKEAISYFDEYSNLINPHNVDDLIGFNNYKLGFARQIDDKEMMIKALNEGNDDILPMLPPKEKLFFNIMELRIRFNSQVSWEDELLDVWKNFEEYTKMDFPEKYFAFKEIISILDKERSQIGRFGHFRQMYEYLFNYFISIHDEIDAYILTLPDYCVYERCNWENERVFLRRFVKRPITEKQEFEIDQKILKHMENIKDIHIGHGNYIQAVAAELNIVDEAMAYARNLKNINMTTQMRDVMQEHLRMAIEREEQFKLHPATNECKLRIARYALFLDQRDVSRKYFAEFNESQISINHYARWLQEYYNVLANEFSSANCL